MSISANCALAFLTVTVVNFYEVQTFQKAHFWHTANSLKTTYWPIDDPHRRHSFGFPLNIPQKALQLFAEKRDERREIIQRKTIIFASQKRREGKGSAMRSCKWSPVIEMIADATSACMFVPCVVLMSELMRPKTHEQLPRARNSFVQLYCLWAHT